VEAMSNIEGTVHHLVAASGQLKSAARHLSGLGGDSKTRVQKIKLIVRTVKLDHSRSRILAESALLVGGFLPE
jgi:hypothetical protein